MKTILIFGKTYTEQQLAEALRRHCQGDGRPIESILDDIPSEGADPTYRRVVEMVHDDPVMRIYVRDRLQRGFEGFGAGTDAFLNVATWIIDWWLLRRRGR